MSLNCEEIDLILKEAHIAGNFIQEIIQNSYDSIAFFLYGKEGSRTLFISLAPESCRINLTNRKIPKNDKPLRFMEFMRSKIKGSRIKEVRQAGKNRIIFFELEHSGITYYMYVRLWSGASNIIITDKNNIIQDVFYRRPGKKEITGGVFTLPEEKESARIFQIRDYDNSITFNEYIDKVYSSEQGRDSLPVLKEQAEKLYTGKILRLEAAIEKLREKEKVFENREQWKEQGDLIMANLDKIKTGDREIICTDFTGNKTYKIPLDSGLSPAENAAFFYDKYKKAKTGSSGVRAEIEDSEKELEELKNSLEKIRQETNPLILKKHLKNQSVPRQKLKKKYPGLTFKKGEWLFIVGRTAAENDELLRKNVKGQDMWFHVRDWSGSYVFVKGPKNKTIPLDIMLDAGNLALYHSKARKNHKGDVYYTQVKYLRRAKNGPKGLVIPTLEKNLDITLDEERLKKLENIDIFL